PPPGFAFFAAACFIGLIAQCQRLFAKRRTGQAYATGIENCIGNSGRGRQFHALVPGQRLAYGRLSFDQLDGGLVGGFFDRAVVATFAAFAHAIVQQLLSPTAQSVGQGGRRLRGLLGIAQFGAVVANGQLVYAERALTGIDADVHGPGGPLFSCSLSGDVFNNMAVGQPATLAQRALMGGQGLGPVRLLGNPLQQFSTLGAADLFQSCLQRVQTQAVAVLIELRLLGKDCGLGQTVGVTAGGRAIIVRRGCRQVIALYVRTAAGQTWLAAKNGRQRRT